MPKHSKGLKIILEKAKKNKLQILRWHIFEALVKINWQTNALKKHQFCNFLTLIASKKGRGKSE